VGPGIGAGTGGIARRDAPPPRLRRRARAGAAGGLARLGAYGARKGVGPTQLGRAPAFQSSGAVR